VYDQQRSGQTPASSPDARAIAHAPAVVQPRTQTHILDTRSACLRPSRADAASKWRESGLHSSDTRRRRCCRARRPEQGDFATKRSDQLQLSSGLLGHRVSRTNSKFRLNSSCSVRSPLSKSTPKAAARRRPLLADCALSTVASQAVAQHCRPCPRPAAFRRCREHTLSATSGRSRRAAFWLRRQNEDSVAYLASDKATNRCPL